MSEPKRWTFRRVPNQDDPSLFRLETPGEPWSAVYVAAQEHDREVQNAVAETVAEWVPLLDEALASAAQLAEAIRVLDLSDPRLDEAAPLDTLTVPQSAEAWRAIRDALAVFDAKEKT